MKCNSGRLAILLAAFQLLLAGAGCADARQQSPAPESDLRSQAEAILERLPLIDGHNDLPWQYHMRTGHRLEQIDFYDTRDQYPPMHTDIVRLRQGRVGAQFWSVYVSASLPEEEAIRQTLEQIDFVHRLIAAWPDDLGLALTAGQIEEQFAAGRVASLLGMEGGHSIGNSLAVLRQMYGLGVRYMTLTHSRSLDWADSATDEPRHGGLNRFGREVIREMNRLGMLVDLSHVSAETMRDAIRVSEAPVIFSHSSARGVSDHVRNVPDDVLDLLKENDGIVMVTFVPSFVSEDLRRYYADRRAEQTRLEGLYPDSPSRIEEAMERWGRENEMPRATLRQVADHIDYIRDRIGVEHIGIGGDYDGVVTLPVGLEDVSTYPDLFAELLRRGYGEAELRRIAGENLLRVMRRAEDVARQLQAVHAPSEVTISDPDESE